MSDYIQIFQYTHILKLFKLLNTKELWKASLHKIHPDLSFNYNEEIWVSMTNLELSQYSISTYGRVKNNLTDHILSSFPNSDNYQKIRLLKNDDTYINTYIHTLMGRLLLRCDDKITTDHLDRNRSNNNIINLRPATKTQQRENTTPVLNHQGQQVYQYDSNHNFIKKWDTVKSIADALPCDRNSLSKACKNKKLFKNCYWSFENLDSNSDEIWKSSIDIYPEYEEFLASSLGKLKRIATGFITSGFKRGGYLSVKIVNKSSGQHVVKQMHELIMGCFYGRQNEKLVNHIDGVKDNNCISNLEYVTASENTKHAIKTGLIDFSNRNMKKTKVQQFSIDGIFIAEFPSIREAANHVGLYDASTISQVCTGQQKTADGYKWKMI
jgi:hypothetical protein